MIEISNLILKLQKNVSTIQELLSINLKMEDSITKDILKTIEKTKKIYNVLEKNSDVPIFIKLIKNLTDHTKSLADNIKLYLASDDSEANKANLISIFQILHKINETLNQINNNVIKKEYIPIESDDFASVKNAIELSKILGSDHENLKNKINNLDKVANNTLKDLDTKLENRVREIDIKLENKAQELKEILGDVESSIARKALSASFLKRAEKLETESKRWLIASLVSILLFIGLAVWNFYKFTQISDLNFDSLNLHIRASIIYSPICISLFWSIWFCTKKYTHLCHLRDEYNYKHDLSESFIGYKNEVTFLDNLSNSDLKLFPILLSAVIQNICKSPLETNNQECHSPWSEIASLVFKKGKDKIDKETN